jgi:hypothetical protein
MKIKFEEEIERKYQDEIRYKQTGIESYEQKLERWKDCWNKELDDDLDNGR